mgnify:CR=1 FL=1
MDALAGLSQALFIVGAFVLFVSWTQKDQFPQPSAALPDLSREPVQVPVEEPVFKAQAGGVTYDIQPLYDYELWGLIVSTHRSDAWFDLYHEDWKDYLNSVDLCVMWGSNVASGVYRHMKFHNGSFTAYARFRRGVPPSLVADFRPDQISNNHLLPGDAFVEDAIRRVGPGDQIRLRGWLVQYSHSNGRYQRGTSVTRTDQGAHACETVYVTDFEILSAPNTAWRIAFHLSVALTVAAGLTGLALWFLRPALAAKH